MNTTNQRGYPSLTPAERQQRENIAAINEAIEAKKRSVPTISHTDAFMLIRRERPELFTASNERPALVTAHNDGVFQAFTP